MTEIKSTMDIIMERTKGLTMSEDEKRVFKERETAGRIKGLVQKCLDGLIDLGKLQAEVAALKSEVTDHRMPDHLLEEECLDRIEPGEDNERILEVLEKTSNLKMPIIREKLKETEERVEQERVIREGKLAKALKQRGVSGSAVIPNISGDPGWNDYVGKMKEEFKRELQGTGYKVQGKR